MPSLRVPITLLCVVSMGRESAGLQPQNIPTKSSTANPVTSRRNAMGWLMGAGVATTIVETTPPAWGAAAVQDSMSVDDFIRTGVDIGGNMGVSSQAGKTKPVTGVFLR